MTLGFCSGLSEDLSLKSKYKRISSTFSYFGGMLSIFQNCNWITKKNNMIMFNKPNITPIVFDMILM